MKWQERLIINKKTSTPKPGDFKDDQSTQTIENEEETDEHLHLQNYKTDL